MIISIILILLETADVRRVCHLYSQETRERMKKRRAATSASLEAFFLLLKPIMKGNQSKSKSSHRAFTPSTEANYLQNEALLLELAHTTHKRLAPDALAIHVQWSVYECWLHGKGIVWEIEEALLLLICFQADLVVRHALRPPISRLVTHSLYSFDEGNGKSGKSTEDNLSPQQCKFHLFRCL